MVALLTSREETAELLKMKQSVATPSLSALSRLFNFPPLFCLAASPIILFCCSDGFWHALCKQIFLGAGMLT
jgi:hypothetical protein